MSSGNVNPHTRDTVPTRDEGGSPYQRRNLLVETSNPRRGRRSRRGRGRGSRRRTSSRARPVSAPGRNHDQELTFPSASRWEQRHSEALHAEHALNCPMGEIVPLRYCSEELLECIRPFRAMSREDIYTANHDRLRTATNELFNGHNRLWKSVSKYAWVQS
ncbi:hypothetical protein IWQ62_003936 [Dispira parvispora]|uniref:Uncharacterized protein n=1 Tax=Dispira parvispora TaxID=1520584 RepID=A0A9W8ALX7_9FUNG|nr:hypothetical protein IWQ62_003936 [Dispira parvispora]